MLPGNGYLEDEHVSEDTQHSLMHGFIVFFLVSWMSYFYITPLETKVEALETRATALETRFQSWKGQK